MAKRIGNYKAGPGRPKGKKNEATKMREAALDAYRVRVAELTDSLLDSQLSLAKGQSFLYVVKTKEGKRQKPERVTNEETIKSYLNGELNGLPDEFYYITTKEPDNQAIESMMNRTYGRPTESLDVTSGGQALPTPILGGITIKNVHPDQSPKEDTGPQEKA